MEVAGLVNDSTSVDDEGAFDDGNRDEVIVSVIVLLKLVESMSVERRKELSLTAGIDSPDCESEVRLGDGVSGEMNDVEVAVIEIVEEERVARSSSGTVGEDEKSVDHVDKSVVVDGFVVGTNYPSEEVDRVEGKSEISDDVDVEMSSNEVDANSGVDAEATVVDSTVVDSTEDGSSLENSTVGDTSNEEKSDEVGAPETVEDNSGKEVEAGDTYDTVVTGKIDISDDGDASNEVGETSDEICEISDEGITAFDVAAGVSDKVFEISNAEGEVSASVDVSVRTAKASDVVDGVSDEVEESSVEVGNIPGVVDEVSDDAEDSSVEVIMPYTDEGVFNK